MPAKNSIKQYIENGYYHIYNRGVEKRPIFLDEQDYGVFLSYIKEYLSSKDINSLQKQLALASTDWREKSNILREINLNNFSDEIKLLAYCLMPNHFHLIIKQSQLNSIDLFMNSLNTRYVMYFNKKYKRVGPLFQGVYKAVLIESSEQLLYLSAYVHNNPIKYKENLKRKNNYLRLMTTQPSSYKDYLGISHSSWICTKPILSHFTKTQNRSFNKRVSYEDFVRSQVYPNILIKDLLIEK
jgi:putative transposase